MGLESGSLSAPGSPLQAIAILLSAASLVEGHLPGSNHFGLTVIQNEVSCQNTPSVFYKDKVQLHPHPAFLPKVVSQFRYNKDIFLLVFFPKSHQSNSYSVWMLDGL